jgi:hypothetical protein
MTNSLFKSAALALAVPGIAFAAPAAAAPAAHSAAYAHSAVWADQNAENGRRHHRSYDRYERYDSRSYGNDYQQGQVWRGNDGRYYCKRSNGTTGLIVGGAGGALLGRELAGRNGDRTLGAILGAVGGALLGREVDKSVSGSNCR